MDYTIEETENWHKKQRVDGSENVDKLAELTYYKDILAIKVDLQAYREGKAADPTELTTILAANTERKRNVNATPKMLMLIAISMRRINSLI